MTLEVLVGDWFQDLSNQHGWIYNRVFDTDTPHGILWKFQHDTTFAVYRDCVELLKLAQNKIRYKTVLKLNPADPNFFIILEDLMSFYA